MVRTILLMPMLLATLVVSAYAQTSPDPELAGVYVSDGVNPDGTRYSGVVEIVKHHDTYELLWSFESEAVAVGLGIRSGNVLAVMHYSGLPGVVAYRIEAGPRLVGEWSVVGADGAVFSETLTKAPHEIGAPATPGRGTRERRQPQPRQRRARPAIGVVVAQSRF